MRRRANARSPSLNVTASSAGGSSKPSDPPFSPDPTASVGHTPNCTQRSALQLDRALLLLVT
eukprot:50128-Prorocentrum_minimum.AAC.1